MNPLIKEHRMRILYSAAFAVLVMLFFLDRSAGLLLRAQAPAQTVSVYNVRGFGAVGDGKTKDTGAIQKAIDQAGHDGGGAVCFPPGKYLSGTIFLKSGVTLHLETGAVLLGSTDLADFPRISPAFRSYTDNYVVYSLIYGENLSDVGITGRGVIDGQGAAYQDPSYLVRPYLIRLVSCSGILVEGVTLRDSPMWVQHYLACDFLTVRGITVISQVNRNNDMIDIDCCRNVRVSDCYADTEDDAMTLKSTADRVTENVMITNCVLGSQCNAIKMGTESNGGFRNITISNCAINSSYRERKGYLGREMGSSGLSLEMVDGGTLENITVSNLTMRAVRVPIFIRLGNRARPFRENMTGPGMGAFRNVTISNIVASDVGEIGCSITGLPGHPVENVTLSNIRIAFPGGGTAEDAAREVPENEDKYPNADMFGTLPAYGFYCRHVDGLRLSNIDLDLAGEDLRPALVCDDVRGLDLDGLTEKKSGSAAAPMMVLRDVRSAVIRGCRPDSGSLGFVRLERGTLGVCATGNDLGRVDRPFVFGEGVPESALFQAANRLKF